MSFSEGEIQGAEIGDIILPENRTLIPPCQKAYTLYFMTMQVYIIKCPVKKKLKIIISYGNE